MSTSPNNTVVAGSVGTWLIIQPTNLQRFESYDQLWPHWTTPNQVATPPRPRPFLTFLKHLCHFLFRICLWVIDTNPRSKELFQRDSVFFQQLSDDAIRVKWLASGGNLKGFSTIWHTAAKAVVLLLVLVMSPVEAVQIGEKCSSLFIHGFLLTPEPGERLRSVLLMAGE